LVPVTPNVRSCAAGSPCTQALTFPSTARTSSATSTGTLASVSSWAPAGSVSTARAPAATAEAANEAPCWWAPGSAANRSPGRTCRLSRATPVIWTAPPEVVRSNAEASSAVVRAAGLAVVFMMSKSTAWPRSGLIRGERVRVGRLTAGRHAQGLQRERGDLLERRRCDRATVDTAARVVHHHTDGDRRVVG